MSLHESEIEGSRSTGGAATNKGIYYQALWTVLQAAEATLSPSDTGLQLVLEPLGGDSWIERPGHRRVVQLKTEYQGTWSLKTIVEDVLTDLYRAIDIETSETITYEFVTAGRMGQCKPVMDFFESMAWRLSEHTHPEAFVEAYAQLDDKKVLKFGGSGGDFWKGAKTEKGIFDRVVENLRHHEADSACSIQCVRRKVWHLLANFRFVGDRGAQRLREDLDAILLGIVEQREQVALTRKALVGELIEKSRINNTKVSPSEMLHAVGLKYVTPIGRDALLRERCQKQVRELSATWGYQASWDVRQTAMASSGIVAISGESGNGKTWRICAEVRAAETLAVVLLRSTNDVHKDLQRAADYVWKDVLGHESTLSLSGISARRADTSKKARTIPWLTIAIDQVEAPQQALALLDEPFEDWGIRVIVACGPAAAAIFEQYDQRNPGRILVESVESFTVSERDEYLHRRIGDAWVTVPDDVRALLLSPQLAGIYCDLCGTQPQWQPQNEYELIEKYWNRLKSSGHGRAAMKLEQLAALVLDDAPYPWDEEQLASLEITEEMAQKMVTAGWLRLDCNERYEISHHRLMAFAVARHLATQHRNRGIEDADLANLLGSMVEPGKRFSGIHLGYVPMDWFFLRSKESSAGALAVFELYRNALDHLSREVLHRELIPTIERFGVSLLWDSFITYADVGAWWELSPVLDGLATRPLKELKSLILDSLSHEQPLTQRAALKLLALSPIADALDRAWELHTQMQRDSSEFSNESGATSKRTDDARSTLYRQSFDALRECARLRPDWVAERIERADPKTEPVHDLAYLCANLLDDGLTWNACKEILFNKVSLEKRRALALNAYVWNDRSLVDWLESVVGIDQDLLGPAAMRALAHIDPKRALAKLEHIPQKHFQLCRNWFLPRLFSTVSTETNDMLHRLILQANDPLQFGSVLDGHENCLQVRTLKALLDALAEAVQQLLEEAKTEGRDRVRNKSHRLLSTLKLLVELLSNFVDEPNQAASFSIFSPSMN